jgi:hypothetical protein
VSALQALKGANLALKFVLELVAIAGFAIWGASVDGTALAVLLAIGTPVLAAVLWGAFAAPRAKRRLPARTRIPFELCVFALAAFALALSGNAGVATAFAVAVAANASLLTAFEQWDG